MRRWLGTAPSMLAALVIFGALWELFVEPETCLSILEQAVVIWLARFGRSGAKRWVLTHCPNGWWLRLAEVQGREADERRVKRASMGLPRGGSPTVCHEEGLQEALKECLKQGVQREGRELRESHEHQALDMWREC